MAKTAAPQQNRGIFMDLNNSLYMLTCYLFNYLIVLRRHNPRPRGQ